MDATLHSNPNSLSHAQMLEEFFNDYPADKAEYLLWRWFVACLRNDFSRMTEDDVREFSQFFERLHELELATQLHNQEMPQSKGGQG